MPDTATPPPLHYWRFVIALGALSLVLGAAEQHPFKDSLLYSGYPPYRNKPEHCSHRDGPIPTGWWDIGAPFDSPHTGHHAMRLRPWPETRTFGRTDFEFHGENPLHRGLSSHGCIVTAVGDLWIRVHVSDSSIPYLQVVAQ